MIKASSALICILFIAFLLSLSGCIQIDKEKAGDLQNVQKTVQLGDAKSVNARISMGVGKLSVSSGSSNLLNGQFIYNMPTWQPEIRYKIAGGIGNLLVSQPSIQSIPEGNVRYEWDISLNQNVPTNLSVSGGIGDTRLKLGGMSLTGLHIDSGTGNLIVDLSGDWKKSIEADIKSGIGNLEITLPRNVGAEVDVSNAIGTIQYGSGLVKNGNVYTNSAYGKSDVILRIRAEAGLGNTAIKVE